MAALVVYLDGGRVHDLSPLMERLIEEVVQHRREVETHAAGSLVINFRPGHIEVSLQPCRRVLVTGNISVDNR